MPEPPPDVVSDVYHKMVAEAMARGMPIKDIEIVLQKVHRYTLAKDGTICLWDEEGQSMDVKVKSRMTSRRNLHKRARRMIGRPFVTLRVAPHRPVEHITLTTTFGAPVEGIK